MTTQEPRSGGSHRRVDRGRRTRVLLVSLLVVVLAGAAVEASLHWRGESKRPSANAATSGYVSPRATPSKSTPSASAPAGPSASAPPVSSAASTLAAVTPPPPATSPPAATTPAVTPTTASPAPSTSADSPATKPLVDILNGTHISGMAARADTTLSHGGWVVALTGNYSQSMSATTVFYPDGQLAAAQALAAQFTAIGKTAPAPDGVSTTHLTLVLGTDWTSSGK
ncbi:MAG TPA: LytR C-terminal domain-containing protein [Acidothermaceae bacterium]